MEKTRTHWYIDALGVLSLKRRCRVANLGQHVVKVLHLVLLPVGCMNRSNQHWLACFVNEKGARLRCQDWPLGQPLLLTSRLLTARRFCLESHQDLRIPLWPKAMPHHHSFSGSHSGQTRSRTAILDNFYFKKRNKAWRWQKKVEVNGGNKPTPGEIEVRNVQRWKVFIRW